MTESSDIDCFWTDLKTKTFQCASDVLGHTKHKHQNWFDMNELTIQPLLDSMREAHLGWSKDKSLTAKKIANTSLRQSVQAKIRSLKENWWMKKAEDLQAAAGEHDMKRFYSGLNQFLVHNLGVQHLSSLMMVQLCLLNMRTFFSVGLITSI